MIRAIYRNHPVEVLDVYETGEAKYAAVRAIEGKPFVGGNKWPIRTEYTTAHADDLSDVTPDSQPEPEQPNLLSMALEYRDKTQWYAGECIWLWRNGNHGAYLKEGPEGIVKLCITDYSKSVIVFLLSHKSWKWEVSRNLVANYHRWVNHIKEAAA